MIDTVLTWLLTYLFHSTLLLGAAWLVDRLLRHPAWSEFVWRCALFGGLFTASVPPLLHAIPAANWWPTTTVAHPSSNQKNEPRLISAISKIAVPDATLTNHIATPARKVQPLVPILRVPDEGGALLAVLGMTWAFVASLGLLRLTWQWLQLRRAISRLAECQDMRWLNAATRLAQRKGLPAPRLLVSEQWDSPLLGSNNTVCVPQWCLTALAETQIEAVLAHELAHQQRADIVWRLAVISVARIGWLQPLNHLAIKRLDVLAEHACDEAALNLTHNRRALAEALYACAHAIQLGMRPSLAAAMASNTTSPLLQRIEYLLKETPMKLNFRPRYLGWAALGLLTVCAIVLPTVALDGRPLSAVSWSDVFDLGEGPSTRMVTKWPEGRLEILARGQIEFAQDSDAVRKVAGRLMLEDFRDGQIQRVTFTTSEQGGLERHYVLNGKDVPMDATAMAWLKSRESLVARTVMGNQKYLQRLLARGGYDAALQEIAMGELQPDLVDALLRQGPLPEEQLNGLLATIDASANDYQRSQSLQAIAKNQALAGASKVRWLQVAGHLQNDYERQQVLTAFVPQLGEDAPALQAWHTALRTLDNDYERRTAMLALVAASSPDPHASMAMLTSMEGIKGSYELTTVMLAVAPKLPPNAEVLAQVEHLARKLPTQERGQVEQALDPLRAKLQSARNA